MEEQDNNGTGQGVLKFAELAVILGVLKMSRGAP